MTPEHFRTLISQVTAQVDGKPLDAELRAWLNEAIGPRSDLYNQLKATCEAGAAAGWLCDRQAGTVRFGRIFQPTDELHGFSVDVVDMNEGVGPHYAHPRSEIDLVMPQEGDAKFDGQGAWLDGVRATQRPPARCAAAAHSCCTCCRSSGEIQFS